MNEGRILVVDDEESIRSVLSDYFTSIGYDVVTAADGEDALKKFIPEVFDIIICDLLMPKMGGLELLKQVRLKDHKVLFLVITGYPSIDSAVESMKSGADDYVTKPIRMDDVRIKVERALNIRRAEDSLRKVKGLLWGLIISIPIWLVLGIILGIVWK
jgi:DNA-binding NtrC family response regulator